MSESLTLQQLKDIKQLASDLGAVSCNNVSGATAVLNIPGSDVKGDILGTATSAKYYTQNWLASKSYTKDDIVIHNGEFYKANDNTTAGDEPTSTSTSTVWGVHTVANDWDASKSYTSGDIVKHNNKFYVAIVNTAGDEPTSTSNWNEIQTIQSALDGKMNISDVSFQNYLENITDIKQIGQSIVGDNMFDRLGHAVSMNADGTIVAVGVYFGEETNGTEPQDTGRVTVYKRNETTGDWDKMGNDIYGPNASDQAGWSVSLSDDGLRLAVGINGYDHTTYPTFGQAGMVRVYQYDGTSSLVRM